MKLDRFLKLARKAAESTRPKGQEIDYQYELECALQYIIPLVSDNDIEKALEEYKSDYTVK